MASFRKSIRTPIRLVAASAVFLIMSLPTAAEPFSHSDWTAVLQKYVDDQGLVDYLGLAEDREALDRYVAAVGETSPMSHPNLFPTRQEALAFYINAYNALVFDGVLSRGPERESVWSGLISGYAFFVAHKVVVGGKEMSLKSLEDKLIREGFKDPRIHAALNCASIGCPRLPRTAFLPESLDAELDAAMREFVTDERHLSVDRGSKTATLSKIFDWFKSDFLDYEKAQGNRKPTLIDYVNRYRTAGQEIPGDYRMRFFKYDKSINHQE